jgi:protein SCO1/2
VVALGCGRAEPLPVLGTVPAFSLTERHGTTVTAGDLAGHVWIADFVFTRCPDICPVLSSRMAALQDKLAGGDGPVRLVSISVDPLHDTPEALSAYAEHYRAGPDWLFLTGSRDAVAALLRDGFRVAFSDEGPANSPITHSDRFVLVDRQLRIRGYYHGNDPADLSRLVADAGRLRAEPPA